MFPITGLFETHITVADLDRSIHFYRDLLGFPLAHVVSERQVAFFWLGRPGAAMLGVWATTAPMRMRLHFALQMAPVEIVRAVDTLKAVGIVPRDGNGEPTDTPSVHAWMPAMALFFTDPDGHSIEFISMLPDAPMPGLGAVSWPRWQELARMIASPANNAEYVR